MTRENGAYSILIVDDDPIIALDAAAMIEDRGYVCHVAYDLPTALRLVSATAVDAALLDYDLGGETNL
jgi:CheY-like chemotaxis protein